VSNSLWLHGLQHDARLRCPSPSPGICSNVCIESVMPCNHLILCCPILTPSLFPSIRVFFSESASRIRWPKYWNFSFSISPSSDMSKWKEFSVFYAPTKSLQSCPTLCDPIDGSPPGSPTPGILQARTLEWVAISYSNAWKWKVKVKSLSRVRLFETPWTASYLAPPSMGFSRQSTGVGCNFLLLYAPIVA